MKNLTLKSSAFVLAGVVALAAAYLAHTVLGIPRAAIRIDALGMPACLGAFIGAGIFAQRRDKWPPKRPRAPTAPQFGENAIAPLPKRFLPMSSFKLAR